MINISDPKELRVACLKYALDSAYNASPAEIIQAAKDYAVYLKGDTE